MARDKLTRMKILVAKKSKSPKSKEDEEEVVEESNLTFEEVPDNLSL